MVEIRAYKVGIGVCVYGDPTEAIGIGLNS